MGPRELGEHPRLSGPHGSQGLRKVRCSVRLWAGSPAQGPDFPSCPLDTGSGSLWGPLWWGSLCPLLMSLPPRPPCPSGLDEQTPPPPAARASLPPLLSSLPSHHQPSPSPTPASHTSPLYLYPLANLSPATWPPPSSSPALQPEPTRRSQGPACLLKGCCSLHERRGCTPSPPLWGSPGPATPRRAEGEAGT